MGPVPALDDRALACAERLAAADRVLLASHIDADGLTSAAVAASALERAAIPFEAVFEKQLDAAAIEAIAARPEDVVLFTDFGSGQLDVIAAHEDRGDFVPVIADHHQPADADTAFHLNPLLEGINGASELSGAGAAYCLARALAEVGAGPAAGDDPAENDGQPTDGGQPADDGRPTSDVDDSMAADGGAAVEGPSTSTLSNPHPENKDLAALAVVGAVGDMQASGGELVGANQALVEEGVEAGVLAEGTDLALYGKQTRPLPKLLEYATEVRIPGVSNDEAGAVRFLEGLDVPLQADGDWRTWADLSTEERRTVASALVQRAVERGVPAHDIDTLVGTTYELVAEPTGTELRDASEFSTLLNATARYERADVGLGVCLGDRGPALERARTLLANHRRNLSAGLSLVQREGVTQTDDLQWFHAGDEIRETIVGIVAGMALGTDGVDPGKPIVAFATKTDAEDEAVDPPEAKVSARGTGALVAQGLDLSAVLGEAARAVGGDGGGHDIAAGATVPAGTEDEFVERADALVGEQLG